MSYVLWVDESVQNAGFPDFGSVAIPPPPSCFVSPGGNLDFVNCATLCADIMSRARGCQQCGASGTDAVVSAPHNGAISPRTNASPVHGSQKM